MAVGCLCWDRNLESAHRWHLVPFCSSLDAGVAVVSTLWLKSQQWAGLREFRVLRE